MKIEKQRNDKTKIAILSEKFRIKKVFKNKKKFNARNNKILCLSIFIIVFLLLIMIYWIIFMKLVKKKKLRNQKFSNDILNENNQKIDNNNHLVDYNNVESIIQKYKREKLDLPIEDKLKIKPILSPMDFEAFCQFMNPKNIYFEFGAGGSTSVAYYYNLTIYSVESEVKWHEKLKNLGIKANYITVDLKAIPNSWGKPGRSTTVEDWKKYVQAYKPEYNADIIFIDGRFRVACALDVFPKIRNDTIILVHDFTNEIYHPIETYYLKVKMWKTLALFVKRPNISSIPEDVYNKFLYDDS